ncbi:pentatricopeptide repeat-containing protein [Cucumis melo var. makuwa]|uniref:Pentatricopeptide repeat-containing protein n=1 Tax=Cucumis melo var. makuwa TaxID=1194695 RepID=A0A5D3CHZ4_CUCMM|nr:pentatricopeptide repeat-containing protein [Cucumis melo var. makuwa]TYK10848.1 pentatricopeptide repeat-containing protein [Cucumis melo var. makuwa]
MTLDANRSATLKRLHANSSTLELLRSSSLSSVSRMNVTEFYFSCHDYASAELVFQTNECPLDVSLWNALLSAYTNNFRFVEALQLFDQLNCNSHFVDAIKRFDEFPQRDVGCWNAVISCYFKDGKAKTALKTFDKMKELGFEPNSVTFTVVVSSCTRLLNLKRGKEIHRDLIVDSLSLGPVAPFDVVACFLAIGMSIIMTSWTENYRDPLERKDLLTQFSVAAVAIALDEKIVLLGAIQSI